MEPIEMIEVEARPAIPGLRFRFFEHESDYAQMAAVISASAEADGVERTDTPEEVANEFTHMGLGFDPRRDLLIAEVSRKIAAYSRVRWWQVAADKSRIYSVHGFTHPEWRCHGLGRLLLRASERRARQIAAGHPEDGVKLLGSSCDEKEKGGWALLTREGYQPVRHFYQMVRPDLENIPDLPLPEGLETRPVCQEDIRKVWDAMQAAFRDHWGYAEASEEWYQAFLASNEFQPDLWQVAWHGDRVIGTVLCFINHEENEKYHYRRGWTEEITVQRDWRGKGVAKALIARGLRALKERGMTEAALGVDTENTSGALRLYERMGYAPVGRETAFRKKLE